MEFRITNVTKCNALASYTDDHKMPVKSRKRVFTQNKRVNCELKRNCTNGAKTMAEIINNARQIGLNVCADTVANTK